MDSLLILENSLILHLSLVRIAINDLQPIAQLPTEIILLIFSFIRAHNTLAHSLAFSQVSHKWRTIALHSPCLWASHNINISHNSALTLITRALPAPISLHAPSPVIHKSIIPILPHASAHIHSLHLRLPQKLPVAFFTLFGALPALVTLSLEIHPSTPASLTTPLPSVRSLTLQSVSVPWDSLTSLTHLSLSHLSLPIQTIHSILLRSPSIALISIKNFDPPCTQPSPLPHPLPLPSLRSLTLASSLSSATHLLAPLLIPTHSHFSLSITKPPLSTPFPSSLSPYTSPPPLTSLILNRCTLHLLPSPLSPPLFTLISDHPLIPSLPSLLPSITNSTTLTHLTLSHNSISSFPLNPLFLSLPPTIHTLTIHINDLDTLLPLLSSPHTLPALQTLAFTSSKIVWWHFREMWLDKVVLALKMRGGVRSVVFEGCAGVGEVVEELQGLVGSFDSK